SNRNQISVVLTQLYCWHLNLVASAGSDVGSECYRRAVPGCAGIPSMPELKTEFKQLHKSSASSLAAGGPIAAIVKYNISTVMCDGYCIKWVKVPLL
uniref:Chal_sti_synt_N domain-containing protein n=1 Tax=Macrostomum lignano TaxID=282301 RepID=A0A1I8FLI2_9PLAT